MPVHELLNVDVEAVSIVGKGANRQVFFMRKEHRPVEELHELTARPELIKAADWSAVYCVVAEPGALEDAGMTGDQSIPDRWANADEIRKAAHRFMHNGGLVNKLHETLEPYGQLVENAVALGDFEVNGHTIRKGSWYVAIEPNDEGKQAIEDGTFTGISIQGSGVRKRVAKSAPPDDRGTVGERVKDALLKAIGKKAGLTDEQLAEIEAIEKGTPSFAERMAERDFEDELPQALDVLRSVVWSAFYPAPDDATDPKAVIERSLDEFKAWASDLLERVPVAKRGDDLGDAEMAMSADAIEVLELAEPAIVKAQRKFSSKYRRGAAKQKVAMPDGSFPIPDKDALKRAMKAVGRAAKGKREAVKAHIRRRAKALGLTGMLSESFAKSDASDGDTGNVGSVDGDEKTLEERVDQLGTKLDELPAAIAKAIKDGDKDEPEGPTIESLSESVDTLTTELGKVADGVKKLGGGKTSQRDPEPAPEPVEKEWKPGTAPAGIL